MNEALPERGVSERDKIEPRSFPIISKSLEFLLTICANQSVYSNNGVPLSNLVHGGIVGSILLTLSAQGSYL
jgi:hypothetical protein